MAVLEGTRPLLLEVQALVESSPLGNPRRVCLGMDGARLPMLLAVLHRHAGVALFDQDVYVNLVGGVRVAEPATDLPLLLAALSSLRDRPLVEGLVAFGEVGLAVGGVHVRSPAVPDVARVDPGRPQVHVHGQEQAQRQELMYEKRVHRSMPAVTCSALSIGRYVLSPQCVAQFEGFSGMRWSVG